MYNVIKYFQTKFNSEGLLQAETMGEIYIKNQQEIAMFPFLYDSAHYFASFHINTLVKHILMENSNVFLR